LIRWKIEGEVVDSVTIVEQGEARIKNNTFGYDCRNKCSRQLYKMFPYLISLTKIGTFEKMRK